MAIITISRQLGSLGNEIATTVADKLNYNYINKRRMGEKLADYGFQAHQFEKYDEKKPSIWLFFSEQSKKFHHLIRAVVYDFAKKDNVVIVGRGGQVLLKDLPGVLRLRIIAPFEMRISRLMEQKGYDEKDAERILRRSDRDSSGYINSFFGVDWADEGLYDFVINTRTFSVDM